MEIHERLENYRKSLNLTQTDFAHAVCVDPHTYSDYESGAAPIPDDFIKLVGVVYDVSENWLRTGEGDLKRTPSVDEELADIFGAFIHDGNPEQKRLVKNFMSLISTVPDDCYPGIDAFIQSMNEKR